MARRIKQGVKRAFNATKRELGPVIKAVAKQAFAAAKKEARARGPALVKKGARFALKNMFGSGDYRTNNLIHGGVNSSPSFGSTSTTYRRREALGQVISSPVAGDFNLQKFRINAGLSETFPWLSGFANNYESWKPTSIILEYVPTSGMSVASSNTALGSITMAAQYNPFAVDPSNLIQIQGYPNAVTAAPYEHALCGIECVASRRQSDTLLIRNSNVANAGGLLLDTGYDTLFDLCEFFIATEGCQEASVKLGQLWISYEITLSNPIVPTVLPYNPSVVCYTSLNSEVDVEYNNLFQPGWPYTTYQLSSVPLVINLDPNNIIKIPYIPPGKYWLSLYLSYGTGASEVAGDFADVSFIASPGITVSDEPIMAPSVVEAHAGLGAFASTSRSFIVSSSNATSELQIIDVPELETHVIQQVILSITRVPMSYPDLKLVPH